MNILKFRKTLTSLALGAALGVGMTSQAFAGPGVFTFDPTGIPGGGANSGAFSADKIDMTTSELLTVTSPTTLVGQGWGIANGFDMSSVPVSNTGLGSQYGFFILFTLTATNTSGVIGTPGSTQTLDTLNFQVYADQGNTQAFTAASINGSGVGVPASPTGPSGSDTLLASGSLINGTGNAGFNPSGGSGGAYLNSTETFSLTPAGSLVFTSPIPFFNMAFDEFNNTSQGLTYGHSGVGAPEVAINEATGSVDFNNAPEPASLAIFGLGLAGLGVLRRKKSV